MIRRLSLLLALACAPALADLQVERTEYLHLPFATFSYANGQLLATWPEGVEIRFAALAVDLEPVQVVRPGEPVPLNLSGPDPMARVDIIGSAVLQDGRQVDFLSPVLDRGCPKVIPAPLQGCVTGRDATGCRVTSETDCADGSHLQVECSGDHGTCRDTGGDTSAGCEGSETRTVKTPGGSETTTTVTISKTMKCPEPEG